MSPSVSRFVCFCPYMFGIGMRATVSRFVCFCPYMFGIGMRATPCLPLSLASCVSVPKRETEGDTGLLAFQYQTYRDKMFGIGMRATPCLPLSLASCDCPIRLVLECEQPRVSLCLSLRVGLSRSVWYWNASNPVSPSVSRFVCFCPYMFGIGMRATPCLPLSLASCVSVPVGLVLECEQPRVSLCLSLRVFLSLYVWYWNASNPVSPSVSRFVCFCPCRFGIGMRATPCLPLSLASCVSVPVGLVLECEQPRVSLCLSLRVFLSL